MGFLQDHIWYLPRSAPATVTLGEKGARACPVGSRHRPGSAWAAPITAGDGLYLCEATCWKHFWMLSICAPLCTLPSRNCFVYPLGTVREGEIAPAYARLSL